jgi:hypothetical protein
MQHLFSVRPTSALLTRQPTASSVDSRNRPALSDQPNPRIAPGCILVLQIKRCDLDGRSDAQDGLRLSAHRLVLPHPRNQPVSDSLRVLLVARQLVPKSLVFQDGSHDQEQARQGGGDERPE